MPRHFGKHYESDATAFPAEAYRLKGDRYAVAWRLLGWHVEPDDDTEWDGLEKRTGQVYDWMSCAHLILDREGIAVPACGSRGRISGQLHKTPPDYARGTCRTCQRIAKARGVQP